MNRVLSLVALLIVGCGPRYLVKQDDAHLAHHLGKAGGDFTGTFQDTTKRLGIFSPLSLVEISRAKHPGVFGVIHKNASGEIETIGQGIVDGDTLFVAWRRVEKKGELPPVEISVFDFSKEGTFEGFSPVRGHVMTGLYRSLDDAAQPMVTKVADGGAVIYRLGAALAGQYEKQGFAGLSLARSMDRWTISLRGVTPVGSDVAVPAEEGVGMLVGARLYTATAPPQADGSRVLGVGAYKLGDGMLRGDHVYSLVPNDAQTVAQGAVLAPEFLFPVNPAEPSYPDAPLPF